MTGELSIDAVVALQVDVLEDIGLSRTGLFFRKAKPMANANPMEDEGWIARQTWSWENDRQTTNTAEITPTAFGVSEGVRIELTAGASDSRPDRAETWTTGTTHVLFVTGDGSQLQLLYEQILKSEAEIAGLITVEQKLHAALDVLIRKLDADPAADGNDPGRVKGLLTEAASATGNQKPPTTNVGGASRVGRQGARSHGVAVGNESINRRGRNKVQEGQDRVPDQKDTAKETKSADPQNDPSTGIGGRKVEPDDANFSLGDVGEWTDDMIDRMDKPQAKNSIVERQGGKLDASVAELMRDMNSKQEQIVERLKTIRKDLKNLYLPTEHLDQLIDQLQANLHSLNDRPSADIFRLQQQTLERVRGVLQVFHQAHSRFQASLPREQRVRGQVLDDPARSVPPGYEDAVKTYYQRLAAPDRTP